MLRNGQLICIVLSRADLLQIDPGVADVPSLSEMHSCGRIGRQLEGACPFFDLDPTARCGLLRGCKYSDPVRCGFYGCELPDVPVCF